MWSLRVSGTSKTSGEDRTAWCVLKGPPTGLIPIDAAQQLDRTASPVEGLQATFRELALPLARVQRIDDNLNKEPNCRRGVLGARSGNGDRIGLAVFFIGILLEGSCDAKTLEMSSQYQSEINLSVERERSK